MRENTMAREAAVSRARADSGSLLRSLVITVALALAISLVSPGAVVRAAQSDLSGSSLSTSVRASLRDPKIAVDQYGFTYIAVPFLGGSVTLGSKTVLFDDPAVADDNRGEKVLIAKFAQNGTALWTARLYSSTGSTRLAGVEVTSTGRLYVAGSTSGAMKFGFAQFTPTGANAGFVAYLNTDSGQVGGGRLFNSGVVGQPGTFIESTHLDSSNSLYISGSIGSNAVFANTKGNITLANPTGDDAFVAKLDTLLDTSWVATRGSAGSASGTGVGTDKDGNVYMAGHYTLAPEFDGISNGLDGCQDDDECRAGFLSKYDKNGQPQWIKTFGGESSNVTPTDVVVDSVGNSYLIGRTDGVKDAATASGKFANKSYKETPAFFVSYKNDGRLRWTKFAYPSLDAPTATAEFHGVVVDTSDKVYVGLMYGLSVTFGTQVLTTNSARQVLVLRYTSGGKRMWTRSVGLQDDRSIFASVFRPDMRVSAVGLHIGALLIGPGSTVSLGSGTTHQRAQDNSADLLFARYEANQSIAVTAGSGRASVSWSLPSATSDLGVAKFRVTVKGSKKTCTKTAVQSTCTITGLKNGKRYSFTVELRNAANKVISTDVSRSTTIGMSPRTPTMTTSQRYKFADLVKTKSKGRISAKVLSGGCRKSKTGIIAPTNFGVRCVITFTVKAKGSFPKMVDTYEFFVL